MVSEEWEGAEDCDCSGGRHTLNHAAIRSACAGPSLQLFVQNFLTRKIQDSVNEFHFVSFLRYGG